MLPSLLSEIVVIITIGMFLDLVLIGRNERNKISQYFDAPQADETLTVRYINFLNISHSIVFGRFFSSRLLSVKFFLSATLVSLFSFGIVVSAQIYSDFSSFTEIRFDFFQIILIISFLSFNVIFDYFTIIQTKIFIEASMSSRNIFRSIVLIGSDLIVTMNTFIIAYAFFVLAVFYFLMWPQEDLNFFRIKNNEETVTENEEPPRYISRLGDSMQSHRLTFSGSLRGVLASQDDISDHRSLIIYYDSTFDPRGHDIDISIISKVSALNVETSSYFSDETQSINPGILESLGPISARSRLLWMRESLDETYEIFTEEDVEYLTITVSDRVRSYGDF